ncbi:MAG: hypothetical protein JWN18_99 [Parcubacteria group bacterium]|nr:hypothetical protein [Parcubacteria group bacterium]
MRINQIEIYNFRSIKELVINEVLEVAINPDDIPLTKME